MGRRFFYFAAMTISLIPPAPQLESAYRAYIQEWKESGEPFVPWSMQRTEMTWTEQLAKWEKEATSPGEGRVPASLWWLVANETRILGALHFRHSLNENLLRIGGHFGYGVRPSERGKGYATQMLKMGLAMAREAEIARVLLTCDDDNIPSAKTIERNGGELHTVSEVDGLKIRRYWISLPT